MDDEEITELHIRNNNIRGIEVEAITEGSRGVLLSFRDQITGCRLAEDVYNDVGMKVGTVGEEISAEMALAIVKTRVEFCPDSQSSFFKFCLENDSRPAPKKLLHLLLENQNSLLQFAKLKLIYLIIILSFS